MSGQLIRAGESVRRRHRMLFRKCTDYLRKNKQIFTLLVKNSPTSVGQLVWITSYTPTHKTMQSGWKYHYSGFICDMFYIYMVIWEVLKKTSHVQCEDCKSQAQSIPGLLWSLWPTWISWQRSFNWMIYYYVLCRGASVYVRKAVKIRSLRNTGCRHGSDHSHRCKDATQIYLKPFPL